MVPGRHAGTGRNNGPKTLQSCLCLTPLSQHPVSAATLPGSNVEFASMIEAKQALLEALKEAIQDVSPGAAVHAAFESPKQAAHGDLAVTAAMQLAKPLKKNPREVAQALVEAL